MNYFACYNFENSLALYLASFEFFFTLMTRKYFPYCSVPCLHPSLPLRTYRISLVFVSSSWLKVSSFGYSVYLEGRIVKVKHEMPSRMDFSYKFFFFLKFSQSFPSSISLCVYLHCLEERQASLLTRSANN